MTASFREVRVRHFSNFSVSLIYVGRCTIFVHIYLYYDRAVNAPDFGKRGLGFESRGGDILFSARPNIR